MNFERKLSFLFKRTLWSSELQEPNSDLIKVTCDPMTYHSHCHLS